MQIDQIRRRGLVRGGLVVILASLVGACADQSEPAPVFQRGAGEPIMAPMPGPPPARHVIVQRGQTLDGYAYTYHVPKAAIIAANGLQPPYELRTGMHLTIPGAGGPVAHARLPVAPPPIVSRPITSGPAMAQATPLPPLHPETVMPPKPQAAVPIPQPPPTPQTIGAPPPSPTKATPDVIPLDGPPPPKQAQAAASASLTPPRAPAAEPPPVAGPGAQASAGPPAESAGGRFPWPVRGHVLAGYGSATGGGGRNDGINIAAPRGTPVRAIDGGTVAYAGNEVKGYGNTVLIRHANGWISAYSHLDDVGVKAGDTIAPGEVIAKVGESGGVGEPQLHFELRRGKKPVDPKEFLAPSPSAGTVGNSAG